MVRDVPGEQSYQIEKMMTTKRKTAKAAPKKSARKKPAPPPPPQLWTTTIRDLDIATIDKLEKLLNENTRTGAIRAALMDYAKQREGRLIAEDKLKRLRSMVFQYIANVERAATARTDADNLLASIKATRKGDGTFEHPHSLGEDLPIEPDDDNEFDGQDPDDPDDY